MSETRSRGRALLFLTLLTLLVYSGTFFNDFVNFDDDRYVSQNPAVLQGLTSSSIAYAFTTFDTANWIPLTWLSLELDTSLFGTSPTGYQATNILLHVVNVGLLFFLLQRLRFSFGNSLAIAAIFAVHPLHVESVTWISERKDVLSLCLLLITMLLFESYTRRPGWTLYLVMLLVYTLGLMAKPMLVTLPLLLLLLNGWPLQRMAVKKSKSPSQSETESSENSGFDASTQSTEEEQQSDSDSPQACDGEAAMPLLRPRRSLRELVLEQVPLILIAIVFGIVTILAQQSEETLVDASMLTIPRRVANATISTAWYVLKTFVPVSLSAYYPLDYGETRWGELAMALCLLVSISAWIVLQGRDRRWMPVGGLWFLISLLPVVGFLQVGGQSHADRYSYLPQIGLLILFVPTFSEWFRRWGWNQISQAVVCGMALMILSGLSMRQVATWRNSETLWNHALKVDPANWMAHYQLGREALQQGDLLEASEHAGLALSLHPQSAATLALMGRIHQERGDWTRADEEYRQVLQIDPKNREGLIGMAAVSHALGQFLNAADFLQIRLKSHPRDRYARTQLGLLYAEMRRWDEALKEFEIVLDIAPNDAEVWKHTAQVFARTGDFPSAIDALNRSLAIRPDDAESHALISRLLKLTGNLKAAQQHATEAARLNSSD